MKKDKEIIIGIDPGYGRMGVAVIECQKGNQKLIFSECFETHKDTAHEVRLKLLAEHLEEVFNKFNPDKIALETLLFSKNVKTAMKVSEARGVILSESAKRNIEIFEYNPNQIKVAVTGYGKSDKKQIITMLNMIFKMKDNKKKLDDEYDAIAVALTCAASTHSYPQNLS